MGLPLKCLFLLLFLILSSKLAESASDYTTLVYKGCSKEPFTDPNGVYSQALSALFGSLVSQSTKTKFFKATAGSGQTSMTGLFQCRGDLSNSDCYNCVSKLPVLSDKLCGKTIAARVQLLGCYMLYEVAGFAQISGMQILFKTCGATNAAGRGFEERRDTAFSVMENGVVSGHGFYATSYQFLYVMGQCEGDVGDSDCGECIKSAVQRAEVECGSSISGQVYLHKCFISYSYYPNGVPGKHSSSAASSSSNSFSSSSSGQNAGKTVAIILGGAAGVAFVFGDDTRGKDGGITSSIGPGGGSGGTVLLFVQTLVLGDSSIISTAGGQGGPSGGGGGGGGRVHFHWSNIPVGDEYVPLASVKGSIITGGGFGGGQGLPGKKGSISGTACPRGLYGIFCEECPVGTYKNLTGSDRALCHDCPSHELPHRAIYIPVRGGVAETPCPYECLSDRYHMPNCYTAFEELVYTFGGPWLFGLLLLGLLVLLAIVLSVARVKYVAGDDLPAVTPARNDTRLNHSFPFLESLNEIMETNRSEESQSHVHRLYFQGPNTFSEPWHLPHCPPDQVKAIVYEDAFNRFVDDINSLATYHWWEGSIYSILCIIAYPLAWSWLQRCRRKKLQKIREFVRSEYDHACLRSCRSRALYEGLKVAATSDLMLAYLDFFLGGDEKRPDLPPHLYQRFPMSIVFGGDGSYTSPFSLLSDNILTSIMSQSVPPTIWYRLVAGLNAQLRLVRRGHLKITFGPVISWIDVYANPKLATYGVRIDLAWLQPTASGYCQFGIVVYATENESMSSSCEGYDDSRLTEKQTCLLSSPRTPVHRMTSNEHLMMPRRMSGGILHAKSLRTLKEKKTVYYPFAFIIYNTKPVGHQDLVGLVISILLLGDFILVLLTLLQMYSLSLLSFFLVLFVLPLGVLFPFPSGISALFSQGPKRSAGLARLYALWNLMSLVNVVVAFFCGFIHYTIHSHNKLSTIQSWSFSMDESEWWILPSGLALCKIIQARLVDCHVANQEIQDPSLYSSDTNVFWNS